MAGGSWSLLTPGGYHIGYIWSTVFWRGCFWGIWVRWCMLNCLNPLGTWVPRLACFFSCVLDQPSQTWSAQWWAAVQGCLVLLLHLLSHPPKWECGNRSGKWSTGNTFPTLPVSWPLFLFIKCFIVNCNKVTIINTNLSTVVFHVANCTHC